MPAFLDCSKCYEGVNHAVAMKRATKSGASIRMANTFFDMYEKGLACQGSWGGRETKGC